MREMTDMDIREAVKNKEKYGEIAEYFKAKKDEFEWENSLLRTLK